LLLTCDFVQPCHRVVVDNSDISTYIAIMSTETILTIRLSAELTEAIETYWHRERLPNRAAAIRELLAYATEQKVGQPAKAKAR
jgi:hypothetical protein